MKVPDNPIDENYRVQALHSLDLLDTLPEPNFDRIVELGKALFDIPTCLISLIDRDRQWFKAQLGLEPRETPRAISFCAHAILRDEVMVVLDATQDDRFHDNPLVKDDLRIRFYAGAPIRLPNGYTIGTVCLISPVPKRSFDADERQRLAGLASLVIGELAVRALRKEVDDQRHQRDRLRRLLDVIKQPVAVVDVDGIILEVSGAFCEMSSAYISPGMSIVDVLDLPADTFNDFVERSAGPVISIKTAAGSLNLTIYRDLAGYFVVHEP